MSDGGNTTKTGGSSTPTGPSSAQQARWGASPSDSEGVISSTNPFVNFRKYRNEFYKAKDIDEVRTLLDNNGVGMSNRFVKDVKDGTVTLEDAKNFMAGTLEAISKFGTEKGVDKATNFDYFAGFKTDSGGYSAYYRPATREIALNRNLPHGYTGRVLGGKGKESLFSIGGHEAMHHIEYIAKSRLQAKGQLEFSWSHSSYDVYTEGAVKRAYGAYKNFNAKHGHAKPAAMGREMGKISYYAIAKQGGRYMYGETISEALNDVWRNGLKATRFSKEIYKQVKRDLKA